MAAFELSGSLPPIKPALLTCLSGRAMGLHLPGREAPVSLADVPSPWRVTRVRLSEAARLAGVSRSSLDKAIKKRRLSCETDQKGQQWIDASDIARAYPGTFRLMPRNVPRQTALERELRERLADKDAVIADLRRRLDAEAEERRQLLAMLSEIQRLLKDHMQAAASAEPSPDPPREPAHVAEIERRTPWWTPMVVNARGDTLQRTSLS